MKNSPSTPSPQLPVIESGSTVSVRNAMLAILLAYGIGRCGVNHDKEIKASENSEDKVVFLFEKNEVKFEEKNMSSGDDGLGEFGCSGLSDKEVAELGKKIRHERALAFRDQIVKKYCITDEENIADLENAALRGYTKLVETIFAGRRVILNLEDDYGNEEAVELNKTECLNLPEDCGSEDDVSDDDSDKQEKDKDTIWI